VPVTWQRRVSQAHRAPATGGWISMSHNTIITGSTPLQPDGLATAYTDALAAYDSKRSSNKITRAQLDARLPKLLSGWRQSPSRDRIRRYLSIRRSRVAASSRASLAGSALCARSACLTNSAPGVARIRAA
jgi:hypothetical protein